MDESAHLPPPRPPHGADPDVDPLDDAPDDAEPDSRLDPELDSHVRALLAAAPDPGPMPAAVSDRIAAALHEEGRLRVERGPVPASGPSPEADASTPHQGAGAVLPMPSRPDRANRPRPVYLVAAVAAAAVVVAAGASALHLTKRPNGAAAIGDSYSSPASSTSTAPAAPSTPAPTNGGLHVQLSRTAYTAGTLAAGARALLDHPGPPLRDLAAESPGIGPIATPIGLESCLEAIGAIDAAHPAPDAVSVDLATFDGKPAAVLVVTRAGASTAWAVERSCTTGTPGVLQKATPVP